NYVCLSNFKQCTIFIIYLASSYAQAHTLIYTLFLHYALPIFIYVQYSNEELERFSNGLFEDYGEIFGRMINLQLKKNQVRGILNVDATQLKGDNAQKQLQEYIDMMFEAFNKNQTKIVKLSNVLN